MAVVSGLLTHITAHSLRYGSARDIAHLRETAEGFVNNTLRQVLGHSNATAGRGITQDYAGAHDRQIWNDRATTQYTSRRDPKHAKSPVVDVVNKKISPAEIDKWIESQPEGSTERTKAQEKRLRQKAGYEIRAARLDSLRATVDVESPQAARDSANTKLKIKPTTPLRTWTHSEINSNKANGESIDPRVWNDFQGAVSEGNPDDMNVPVELLETFTDMIIVPPEQDNTMKEKGDDQLEDFGSDKNSINEPVDIVDQMALDQEYDMDDHRQLEAMEFVEYFSTINITNQYLFSEAFQRIKDGRSKQGDEGIIEAFPHGYSRDNPLPFTYTCTVSGCQYSSTTKADFQYHRDVCTEGKVAKAQEIRERPQLTCPVPGCRAKVTSAEQLKRHMKVHDTSTHRPCPDGCNDGKLLNPQQLKHHKNKFHPVDDFTPALCTVPDCVSRNSFEKRHDYEEHLQKAHKFITVASRKPFLPMAITEYKFRPGICPIDACEYDSFATWVGFTKHLVQLHPDLTTEQRRAAYRDRVDVDSSVAKRPAEDIGRHSKSKRTRVDEEEL
ncbi:MAG: hypothetical protein Q9226_000285 [Calogaya cf. arnoldii]